MFVLQLVVQALPFLRKLIQLLFLHRFQFVNLVFKFLDLSFLLLAV